jgi:8-oxo-dGTP pyrophosphatase MutT (NUDIX family)
MKTNNPKIKTEVSAGCVVFRRNGQELQFALGKHSGYHKWVLPKGMIEKGEDKLETAVREVAEEFGLMIRIIRPKPVSRVKYTYFAQFKTESSNLKTTTPKVPNIEDTRRVINYQENFDRRRNLSEKNSIRVFKTVYFYLAEYLSGDLTKHGWEMEETGWFNYENALEKLAFQDEKEALVKAWSLLTFPADKNTIPTELGK